MAEGKRLIKEISVTAHLDERFAHSPDVSGFRYIFGTESVRGVFYVGKEVVGSNPLEKVTLILKFKRGGIWKWVR